MVPGLAGMSRMRYWRFLLFNVIGGEAWATNFALLGYFRKLHRRRRLHRA